MLANAFSVFFFLGGGGLSHIQVHLKKNDQEIIEMFFFPSSLTKKSATDIFFRLIDSPLGSNHEIFLCVAIQVSLFESKRSFLSYFHF